MNCMEKVRGKAIYELFAKVKMNHNALKKVIIIRERRRRHIFYGESNL